MITACSAALPVRAEEAEEDFPLPLEEAIRIAQVQSVDAAVALNELRTAYWQYRTHKAEQLPEVIFTGTLPSYNKQYAQYQQSDGSYTYVRNNHLGMNGEITISQNIALTGGKIELNTSLDFNRQLGSGAYNEFMSVPVGLTLTQPIFGVNDQKWKRRIEPVRYEEAKAAFMESVETVTLTTITHYFNLLLAEDKYAICRQNLENAEKLYDIAVAKRKIGQISEMELIQLKQNALRAKSDLTDAEANRNAMMFQLRSFLGLSEEDRIVPSIPEVVPGIRLDYHDVLEKAHQNNAFAKSILRQQLEADYAVATAKGERRSINLFASVGYTGKGDQTEGAGARRRVEPRRGALANQEGRDGLQPEYLPAGRELQQPGGTARHRDGGRFAGRHALSDIHRDLYGGKDRHPRPQRRADAEGRCEAETHRGAVLLLVLFLQYPQPDVV